MESSTCSDTFVFSILISFPLIWKTRQSPEGSVENLCQPKYPGCLGSSTISGTVKGINHIRWQRCKVSCLLFLSMPFIEVSSTTGNIRFHYTISTPRCDNADELDPDCPVLLFFHALAFPEAFHCALFVTLKNPKTHYALLQYQLNLVIRCWESLTSLFLTWDGKGTQKVTHFHSLTDKKKQRKT